MAAAPHYNASWRTIAGLTGPHYARTPRASYGPLSWRPDTGRSVWAGVTAARLFGRTGSRPRTARTAANNPRIRATHHRCRYFPLSFLRLPCVPSCLSEIAKNRARRTGIGRSRPARLPRPADGTSCRAESDSAAGISQSLIPGCRLPIAYPAHSRRPQQCVARNPQ